MSRNLKIVPTRPLPTWGDVRLRLNAQEVVLRHLGGDLLRDDDRLELDASYSLEAPGLEPLFLDAASNKDTMLDPADWLDEFGRNLPDRAALAAAWKLAGYYLGLESRTAPGDDLWLVGQIAGVIAEAVDGYVCLATLAGFELPEGTYTPEEFRSAHPPEL